MIQRHVFISGRVQGVGFRRSVQAHAARFPGLRGYVRNRADGRVEAVFCSDQNDVLEMVAWCEKGPPSSVVEILDVIEETPDDSLPPFETL